MLKTTRRAAVVVPDNVLFEGGAMRSGSNRNGYASLNLDLRVSTPD